MKTNEALKVLRQAKGITQSEAAAMLEVSLSSYQKYERDKDSKMPSLEVLCRMADLYETSTDYLLGRPENMPVLDDETYQLITDLKSLPAEKRKAVCSLLRILLSNS